jgi:Sec-independent protein secretion pathway component TatC
MGMVTDILVNNIFRFFATTEGANDKWMMFPKKKYVNFFLNIIYAFGVLMVVIWLYNIINVTLNAIFGTEMTIYLGVEPLMFGMFYMGVDLAFVGIKRLVAGIISDAKNKNGVK